MTDIGGKYILKISNLLKTKNIIITIIAIILLNVFLVDYFLNLERNFISINDLDFVNKYNFAFNIDKNIKKIINISVKDPILQSVVDNKDSNDYSHNKNISLDYNDNLNLNLSYQTCKDECEKEKNFDYKNCLNQCLRNISFIKFETNTESKYVFILFGLLFSFILSFILYLKKHVHKFEIAKDHDTFIQTHLLEGYDLLSE